MFATFRALHYLTQYGTDADAVLSACGDGARHTPFRDYNNARIRDRVALMSRVRSDR